jgi:hypothetical protein
MEMNKEDGFPPHVVGFKRRKREKEQKQDKCGEPARD